MSYATQDDLQQACGGAVRFLAAFDWDSDGVADPNVITKALAGADAEINTYVNKQYRVPLVGPFVTAIAAGSAGMVLPQATIDVANASTFPNTGDILVMTDAGVQIVSYTGVTATSFTGCTGGLGTMALSAVVQSRAPQEIIEIAARIAKYRVLSQRGMLDTGVNDEHTADIMWLKGVRDGENSLGCEPIPTASAMRIDAQSPRPHGKRVSKKRLHGFT